MDTWHHLWQQMKHEKILYLLAVLCIAMVVDFISGCIAAKVTNVFSSNQGVNGILRKIAGILLLVLFLPIAGLIPANTGIGLLYVLYSGYLLMELQSILENCQRLGINTQLFQQMMDSLRHYWKK